MNSLNLDQLTRKVSERTNLSISEAKEALKTAIDVIVETLKKGSSVKIRKFGSLEPITRKERKRYNFQTGEIIKTPKTKSVIFKVSKNLKDELNK